MDLVSPYRVHHPSYYLDRGDEVTCRPSLLGCFSLNGARQFQQDMSQLKYYDYNKVPAKPLDLQQGIDAAIKKDTADLKREGLQHILRWILAKRHHFSSPEGCQRFLPQFVCYRGLLTAVMCTPYEQQEGWKICASMFLGTIYLFAMDTEQKKKSRRHDTERMKAMQAWGFKFEQYIFTDDANGKPKTNVPVNENEEFSCVFTTRIATCSVLFAAEMDGVESRETLTELDVVKKYSNKFVEAKTTRVIETRGQDITYRRHKIMKWWAQCTTVGVTKIVRGLRDDDGLVHEVGEVDVADLPNQGKDFWDPTVCMTFLNEFLQYVKSVVTTDSPKVHYCFSWSPNRPIITAERYEETNDLILPEWYTNAVTTGGSSHHV